MFFSIAWFKVGEFFIPLPFHLSIRGPLISISQGYVGKEDLKYQTCKIFFGDFSPPFHKGCHFVR